MDSNRIPQNIQASSQASEKTDSENCAIIGAAMTVHRELGPGFLENVYQAALEREFEPLKIPYEREKEGPIIYRGLPLNTNYRADFICYDSIIAELKALSGLGGQETSQVLNLKATQLNRALLLNFSTTSLQHKRIALNQ